jgi:hypothetical protein
MIGHVETINLLATKSLKAVIISVGKKPDWVKSNEINVKGDSTALIYTENSRPKKNDLAFIKNLAVQLLHGADATDELFSKWFIEVVNSNPKSIVAVDSEMEIYVS